MSNADVALGQPVRGRLQDFSARVFLVSKSDFEGGKEFRRPILMPGAASIPLHVISIKETSHGKSLKNWV